LGFFEGRIGTISPPDKKFDVITTSNIFDWANRDQAVTQINQIATNYLRPGGMILMRRALGDCSVILKQAGGHIGSPEEKLNAELFSTDRNPFFYQNPDEFISGKD